MGPDGGRRDDDDLSVTASLPIVERRAAREPPGRGASIGANATQMSFTEALRVGQSVRVRKLVWAIFGIAARALTGEPPFRGFDTPELLYNVVHAATPLASRCAPELSPAVDAVLARALAKKPDDRFACAADLATALAQALDATR
jgi:serine/threonine protein kinase